MEELDDSEVGKKDVRNEGLELIGTELADWKTYYLAQKRELKKKVENLKKTHLSCRPSKLKFSGGSKKDPPTLTLEKISKRMEIITYMNL